MTLISQAELPAQVTTNDPCVAVEHFRDNAVRVTVQGRTIGYIEVVGRLFVSLAGHRYDRAVEVRQSLILETAIDDLVAHDRLARHAATE